MVEMMALRRALAAFLGDERFRKFVRQGFRRGQQLRYWQEQEWSRFTAAHPEFAVGMEVLEVALRICELHDHELLPDTVEVFRGFGDFAGCSFEDRQRLFPHAASRARSTEGELVEGDRVGVWYCPVCRQAEAEWLARHQSTLSDTHAADPQPQGTSPAPEHCTEGFDPIAVLTVASLMREANELAIGSLRGHAVAHFKVDRRGAYFLNGKRVSLEEVKEECTRLTQIGGAVFYYRENAGEEAPPAAKAVIAAICEACLPFTCAGRDYDPAVKVAEYFLHAGTG
jgi:hypothetical protein